jgi:ornithine carbamoyltransferase
VKQTRHFLSVTDLSATEIIEVFTIAKKIKNSPGKFNTALLHKTMAMIFEKPSLRTRVSFESGMTQLGGHAIYLGPQDIQMGERESASDIARNLERMVDLIMARVFDHAKLTELSKNTLIPVINGLSDLEHPCQAMADIFTVWEKKEDLKTLKIAFVGDCENNVTHSLALLCHLLGIEFAAASPPGYEMRRDVSLKLKNKIMQSNNPVVAVKNADVVVTDTWVSMGDEKERKTRLKLFPPFQVNLKLMEHAKNDAMFLHCLPAYRGYEVTKEVIDGPKSVVYDEAENRLHIQKALILFLLGAK